jgi:hypothetical protein
MHIFCLFLYLAFPEQASPYKADRIHASHATEPIKFMLDKIQSENNE